MAKSMNADRQNRGAAAKAPGRSQRERETGPESPPGNGSDAGNGSGQRNGSAGTTGGRRLSGIRAAAMAQQQLEMMIQRPCEGVSGLSRHGDGWMITLEVVELERVPPTTDILATYRVELDDQGELMGYERVSRYYRNQAGGDS